MKQLFILLMLMLSIAGYSQGQQPERKDLRIADTLTAQEKISRNPIILQAELDSLYRLHDAANLAKAQLQQEPVVTKENAIPLLFLWIGIGSLLIIACLLVLFFRSQQRFNRSISSLRKQIQNLEWMSQTAEKPTGMDKPTTGKGKTSIVSLEKKIQSLTSELEQAEKQNQGLEMVMDEYRHIKQEYESVKQQMMDIYKIRNYPGFAKEKSETEIVKGLLNTERSVALYAYEHFLKPVILIADANKNNPAKISSEERERMLDLLVSLALLYSEYLYLRVNDLSVGGNIVERIGGLKNGNTVDLSLLKELNLEHGSRALALRMALDKMGLSNLSYPVFDETNLNLS